MCRRYTLASSDDELVSLARELEMVNDYLALEGVRLAERLHVQLHDGREIQISRRQARQFRERTTV